MDKRSSTPKVVTKKHIARLEREQRQIRLIRGMAIGGIVVVVALLVYGYLNMNVFSKQQAVALVNGAKITIGQFQERVRLERVGLYNQLNQYKYFQQAFGMDTTQQQQDITTTLDSTGTMGDRVLNTMIDEVLIRQKAKERGITVSSQDVDKFIQDAYGFNPGGTPTPTVTPTEFAYPNSLGQAVDDVSPDIDTDSRTHIHTGSVRYGYCDSPGSCLADPRPSAAHGKPNTLHARRFPGTVPEDRR